jgi:hypothetical protein
MVYVQPEQRSSPRRRFLSTVDTLSGYALLHVAQRARRASPSCRTAGSSNVASADLRIGWAAARPRPTFSSQLHALPALPPSPQQKLSSTRPDHIQALRVRLRMVVTAWGGIIQAWDVDAREPWLAGRDCSQGTKRYPTDLTNEE